MSGLTHYKYIDALRGFAFLGVLSVHTALQTQDMPGAMIVENGKYGVQLFFLLSAVTLLRSVSVRASKEHFFTQNFYLRRFFRIAPLFWSGIIFYLLINGTKPQGWAPQGLRLWHFIVTALFVHGWVPDSINSVVPGGWSIAVEMTFYLCLPLLARWITSARMAFLVAVGTGIFSVWLNYWVKPLYMLGWPPSQAEFIDGFLYFWFPTQLPVFLLGFVVYYLLHNPKITTFLAVPHRPMGLLVCALLGIAALLLGVNVAWLPPHLCYSLMFAAIIVALAARPLPLLVNRVTCYVGTISFSAYITHFAAITLSAHFFKLRLFTFRSQAWAEWIHFGTIWTVALLLTVIASTLTYHFIERPGMQLGSFLVCRREAKYNPLKVLPQETSGKSFA